MQERLTWEQIEQRYNKQWVQLVDFDWPETEPWPLEGIVRVHAASKEEFNNLTLIDPPDRSACIFVGGIKPLWRVLDEDAA